MSNENTNNFWQAISSWIPEEAKPISYRLYYDDSGIPLFYTMDSLPGNYIEVDREIYLQSPSNARVIDGKLKIIRSHYFQKLVPSNTGVPCHVDDVCVVVDQNQTHVKWDTKVNDTN